MGAAHRAEDLKRVFAIFDKDGDHLLSKPELKALVGNFGIFPTETELGDLVDELSGVSGATSVTEAQFLEFMRRQMVLDPAEELAEVWKLTRAKGAQEVTPQDFKALMRKLGETLSDEEAADFLAQGDPKGAGKIGFDEFVKLLATTA